MNISANSLLILGVFCFYIYDSIRLQEFNKFLVTLSFNGWKLVKPLDLFSLAQKVPSLPNPLTPFFATHLLEWSVQEPSVQFTQVSDKKKYLPIQIHVFLLFIEMLVLLPLVVTTLGMGNIALLLVCSIYITILSCLITLYIHKLEFQITPKHFFSIVLDCLACPPFAINILRRVAIVNSPKQDLLSFAKDKFKEDEFQILLHVLINKLDYQIDFSEPDSDHYIELIKCRKRYLEMKNDN